MWLRLTLTSSAQVVLLPQLTEQQALQACIASTTLGFCIFHLVLVISALLASLP